MLGLGLCRTSNQMIIPAGYLIMRDANGKIVKDSEGKIKLVPKE